MPRIIDSIALEHDLAVVALAALLCALGSAATVLVSGRALAGGARLWTVLSGVCLGSTVWSTHFIAMLAWRLGLPITYDPGLTALSFLAGVAPMTAGFAIAVARPGSRAARALGGAIVGAGVAALHYIGMAGVHLPGTLDYASELVAASVGASVGLGTAAFLALFSSRTALRPLAGALLLLMTVSLHFVGMSAAELSLGPVRSDFSSDITRSALVAATGVAALAVLLIGTLGAVVDRRVSARLATEAERFRTLADGAFEGLIVHRDRTLVDSNAAARRLLGLDGDGVGASIAEWRLPAEAPAGEDGEPAVEEVELRDADGRAFPAEIRRRAIRLPGGGAGELVAIRDLSTRKAHEARIAHLAMHDPLTDLPNRRFFVELAEQAFARVRDAGREGTLALMAMDLDDFKAVNDLHGHAVGDVLIRTVAARIKDALDGDQVVARLGGDEFMVIDPTGPQPERAMALAERLHAALAEPIELDDDALHPQASIGIAVHPGDGDGVEELMRNADTSMYRAKTDGKGLSRCFESRMNEEMQRRRRLESRLRLALREGSLDVHYQPLVDGASRAPLGFEALVRWRDEELGDVAPSEFVPLAESVGLILPLGQFVLDRACAVAARWPTRLRVAVNLSVAQFRQEGLTDTVRAALASSGLPGERLEIEITESLLIEDRARALELLAELGELGIRVAMDDFGTGYSSLGYLHSFDFHKLKIDRAFVMGLDEDARNASIVQAVVSMGKSLGMRVVAEGVETEAQAALLAALGCDELQGYLIARPMPAAAVDVYLAASSPVDADDPPLAA